MKLTGQKFRDVCTAAQMARIYQMYVDLPQRNDPNAFGEAIFKMIYDDGPGFVRSDGRGGRWANVLQVLEQADMSLTEFAFKTAYIVVEIWNDALQRLGCTDTELRDKCRDYHQKTGLSIFQQKLPPKAMDVEFDPSNN